MDALDQIIGPAGALLRRVDSVLSESGAPAEHGVWAEIRRVRLLPGDAVHAVLALRAADLQAAVPHLRADVRAVAETARELPGPGGWSGTAAAAYDDARRELADQLSGAADSLDARLRATADWTETLVDWMRQTRDALAGTLAAVVTSTEAIVLCGPAITDPSDVRAAADVAAHVLRCVGDSYDRATELLHDGRWLVTPTG